LLNEEKGHGKDEKVNQQVGSKDNHEKFREGVKGCAGGEEGLHGNSIGCDYSCGHLLSFTAYIIEKRIEKRSVSSHCGRFDVAKFNIRSRRRILTPFSKLELLVGIGRVVKPLPSTSSNKYINVLEDKGCLHLTKLLKIVLDEIRILKLRKIVVVTIVMFNIPRLRHHPVKPVEKTPPERSNGKLKSVPTLLIWMALIISSMTGVVSNHGPSGESPGGQTNDSCKVDAKSHGEHSNEGAHVGPPNHFIQVAHIIVSLLLFESLS